MRMNLTWARTVRGLPFERSEGNSRVTHDPGRYSCRERYKHPWQFTDNADVDSKNVFPIRLCPETLNGTALKTRVLRRALLPLPPWSDLPNDTSAMAFPPKREMS